MKSYTETDVENVSPFFDNMTYTEDLATDGVGINLKLGIIYRISQALRVGATVHSPTYFALSDNFSTSVTSNLTINNAPESYSADSPVSNFNYQLVTPWRASGSLAYIFGRSGFITGEIEYVTYNSANFSINDDPTFEQDLNDEISTSLTEAINFRVGGEMIFGKVAVRGGYGVNLSPYDSTVDAENEVIQTISIGIGLRTKRFFIDAGYSRAMYLEEYQPYTANSTNVVRVINDVTRNRLIATVGFRF